MDCSTLSESEHKLLAEVTILARKSRKKVFAKDNSRDLQTLAEDGWIERLEPGYYTLLDGCSCEQIKRAAATHRGANRRSIQLPELRQQTLDGDSGEATSVGSKKDERVDGNRACEGTLSVSQPLRSRGGSGLQFEELLTTDDYSRLSGKTVSGRRSATEVSDKLGRANTPAAWQDKPVEKWNAVNLAGYFSAQAWDRCKGLSPDLYNTNAQMKHMARLRKFGISNEDIKRMVDIYLDRSISIGHRVPSLWKTFFSQVPNLQVLLTSTAMGQYNNQPTAADDDEEFL